MKKVEGVKLFTSIYDHIIFYVSVYKFRNTNKTLFHFNQFNQNTRMYNMAHVDDDDHIELQIRDSAFKRRIHTFAIVNKDHIDVRAFLNDASRIYEYIVSHTLEKYHLIKTFTVFVAEFEKKTVIVTSSNDDADESGSSTSNNNEKTQKETLYLTTSNKVVGLETNLSEHYQKNIIDEVVKNVDDAAFRGSGFSLKRIVELSVQINSYEPLGGSSYIKTPKTIRSKNAIINVQNFDEMCFKWAILSALHPPEVKNPHKLFHYYAYNDELNFNGIEFPVRLNQIDKFTRQNNEISINVYYYDEDDECVRPLRVSSDVKKHHIHLLLLYDKLCGNVFGANTTASKIEVMLNNGPIRMHYCWIKNLSRLVSSQLSKHEHKKYICDRCLNYFTSSDLLTKHSANCENECKIEMPTEEKKYLQFENYANQLKAPFVVYADTEAFLKNLNVTEQKHVFSEECKTKAYQQHHVYSVGYYFKCEFDISKSYYASSGNRTDCVEWFVEELEKISKRVASMISDIKPMNKLSSDEERLTQAPNAKCFICEEPFGLEEIRHRDHCHFTGKFRGVAHSECNLNYQESRTIPVIMHNLSGYDAHLLIKQLALKIDGCVTIIPLNAEEYVSFTKTVINSTAEYDMREKIKLKFIDSFRFMPTSLSKLASLIPTNEKRILNDECKNFFSSEQIAMLDRKGVFPYDYVDSFERLNETSLPSKEFFYNKLNDEEISDENYDFACNIWKKFRIKTLGEYSELYMKTDVLLLADVFENFRNTCYQIYKLDPAHYYTSPGLSFDAMLKFTRIKIELQTDIEKFLYIERGIRGGITQCSKRYIKGNNPFMKTYKPHEKTIYGAYFDRKFFMFLFCCIYVSNLFTINYCFL